MATQTKQVGSKQVELQCGDRISVRRAGTNFRVRLSPHPDNRGFFETYGDARHEAGRVTASLARKIRSGMESVLRGTRSQFTIPGRTDSYGYTEPVFSFERAVGRNRFYIQFRDNAGTITRRNASRLTRILRNTLRSTETVSQ